MTTKDEIIKYLKSININYAQKGFKVVSLFGSYAKDSSDLFSDIDLTYKINHNIFYKDDAYSKIEKLQEIKRQIENRFHTRVDLIPANTSNRFIQDNINSEQVFI